MGHAAALAVGLLSAFVALRASHAIDPQLISPSLTDFSDYFSAARLVVNGHAGSIYGLHAVAGVESQLSGQHGRTVNPYFYPPFFALLMVPFALLPFGVAYVLWFLLNCVAVSAVLYSLEGIARVRGRSATIFGAGALVFLPTFLTLILGQVSIYLLGAIVLAYLLLREHRPVLSGACLSVVLLKPPYLVPFFVVALARRQWTVLTGVVSSVALLIVLPVPVMGLNVYSSYAHLLLSLGTIQGQQGIVTRDGLQLPAALHVPAWNQSLAGMVEAMGHLPQARMLEIGLSAALLVLLFVVAMRVHGALIPTATATVVALLISPHTLVYDLALLLFPAAAMLSGGAQRRIGAALALGALLVLAGLPLAFFSPIHLSVIVMLALVLMLLWPHRAWLASFTSARR